MKEVTVTYKLYKFDELSDEAKEKAREWYREGMVYDEWWDAIYEDATICANCLGIDLATKAVPLMNGKTRYVPCIWFSGFWDQGDGACFEGRWSYKADAVEAIKDHAPKDQTLHDIAKNLAEIQSKYGNKLSATVKHRGRRCHEYSTDIEIYHDDDDADVELEDEKAVVEELRNFMRWIYHQLKAEYEYLNSDENVDENIRINEYDFFEDGSRACL